ncbi:envelope-like protein, partial [Trifolium medium]|nr:envelope-like protein [Trifolium medium]
ERSVERTPVPSIAKRLRSQSGKTVPTASGVTKTTKPSKTTGLKPVHYGPKRTWKVATTGTSSRKSIGGKKVPLNVPTTPIDNVSFHHENSATRWKYIYNRKLSLERELAQDALECQDIIDLIDEAGLTKTVWGLGSCYEKLVK